MYAIYGNMEPINTPNVSIYTIHLGDFVRANVGIHIPAPAGSVMGIFICEAQLLAAQSSKKSKIPSPGHGYNMSHPMRIFCRNILDLVGGCWWHLHFQFLAEHIFR